MLMMNLRDFRRGSEENKTKSNQGTLSASADASDK
jgi:hypothetical protein